MTRRQHEAHAIAWALTLSLSLLCARAAEQAQTFPRWATLPALTLAVLAFARTAVHYRHAYLGAQP